MSLTRWNIALDERGFPVLLANVPGSGAHTIDPDAKGGNPAHDTRSGKFAAKGKKAPASTNPPNADPVEFARMLDAVRDAAREFDSPDIGDIKDFLSGRARDPSKVDLEDFLKRVRAQRLSDIVDLLDQQFRNKLTSMKIGRRRVKVSAPRGWMRRAMRDLTPEEVAEIGHRLQAKGFDEDDIDQLLVQKRPQEEQDPIRERKATFSDQAQEDPFGYNL